MIEAFDGDICCLRIGETEIGVTSVRVKRVVSLTRCLKSIDLPPQLVKIHLNVMQYREAISVLEEAPIPANIKDVIMREEHKEGGVWFRLSI